MGVRKRRNKRKKYQYRATSRRKQIKMKKKINPLIDSLPIKNAWDKNKPAPTNIADMGLIYNLNKGLSVNKEQQMDKNEPGKKKKKKATEVVQQLEEAASKESEKRGGIRLTNAQVEYATAMLDKHGYDYKAMTRDPRNYFQDTWKQIRTKIKLFVNNPTYFAPYLKERGMLKPENLKSQESE